MTRLIQIRRSLFFRFPLYLGVIVLIVLLVIGFIFRQMQARSITRGYRSILQDASTVAALLATHGLEEQPDPSSPVFSALGHYLLRISLVSDNGLKGWTAELQEGGETFQQIRVPVKDRSGRKGALVFDYSSSYIQRTLTAMQLLFFMILFLALMLILTSAYFLLLRLVRRPLSTLMKATESVARGDFSVRVRMPVRDELALLGVDITAMSYSLKRSFNEIEEKNREISSYSEELEDRVAIRTSELHNANKELEQRQEQLDREMEMARRVQLGIIPNPNRHIAHANLEVALHYEAMQSVGGDLVDMIRVGRNKYACLIADVSGHGVPSALITSMVKVSFMTNCKWERGPAEICSRVNREMVRLIGDQGFFVSAYLAILNMETGELVYTNAGHHPATHYTQDGYSRLDSAGCLLGVWPDSEYREERVMIEAGDRVILFTDGIVEARNIQGELYGTDRLLACFDQSPPNLAAFVSDFVSQLGAFCGGREADDDRALLFLRYKGTETLASY